MYKFSLLSYKVWSPSYPIILYLEFLMTSVLCDAQFIITNILPLHTTQMKIRVSMAVSLLRCASDIRPGVTGSDSDPQDPGPLCISEDLRTNSILATSLILNQLAPVIWLDRDGKWPISSVRSSHPSVCLSVRFNRTLQMVGSFNWTLQMVGSAWKSQSHSKSVIKLEKVLSVIRFQYRLKIHPDIGWK